MDIQTFHRYNRLVRQNKVKPLTCTCGTAYTMRATEDAEPVLQCFMCNSLVQPGLKMYNDVQAVVKEHFE